jgi:transcriptional regulator with XRE-family HTH domain
MPNPHARANPALVAEEQERVLELKKKGLTVRAIAAELGVSKSTVQNRLDAAIAEIVHPAAEAVRTLELDRLDSWHAYLEDRLVDPLNRDPEKTVQTLLRCQERRARYLGLDAPEKAEITATVSPADEELAALLREARAQRDARLGQVRGES